MFLYVLTPRGTSHRYSGIPSAERGWLNIVKDIYLDIVDEMSLYTASRGFLSIVKDNIRGQYLGRHMDHLVNSIANLSQGRKNCYVGREGFPVDDSPGEKYEPVIV